MPILSHHEESAAEVRSFESAIQIRNTCQPARVVNTQPMLTPPDSFDTAFRVGFILCFAFGAVCSIPAVWETFFKKDKDGNPVGGAYLKAGEYGETELNTSWSVFKEPLNSWTSLAYSLFGVMICHVGVVDYMANGQDASNRMTADAGFSLLIGVCCVYLGISSFLFHASHTEPWRKADAGMTSGICIPLVLFAIWDRTRLHGLNCTTMLSIGAFLLFSLTHGFVPYGSSDILLPSMIIILWSLELVPRYGGPVHDEEYLYWVRCLFAVLGGALLRAIDVKRKAAQVKNSLLALYFVLLAVFGFLVGFIDDATICALVAGIVVVINPARGHIFWHIASAYALYIWWYLLRIRPGDRASPYHSDSVFFNFLLFIAVKNGFRRLIMNIPARVLPLEYQDRVRSIVEHTLFSVWGLWTVVEIPTVFHSWLLHPILCWYKPVYPSSAFLVYFTAKVAAHAEDVLYLWVSGTTYTKHDLSPAPGAAGSVLPSHASASEVADKDEADPMRQKSALSVLSSRQERADGERLRSFHHNIAALMAVTALFAGYAKIGSLVALSHDLCEVPLDLFKLAALKGMRNTQIVTLGVTLLMYLYWRVWFFCSRVLYTVTFDSKTMIDQVDCVPGDCSWSQVPERAPFLMCLIVLLGVNCVSITRMVRVGYRVLHPSCVV